MRAVGLKKAPSKIVTKHPSSLCVHYTQTAIVKRTSESKNCMHNQCKGLGGNLANLPVKIREFLRQFQVVIVMIMMTTTLRFVTTTTPLFA